MDYIIICLVSSLASGLTLFSGFGLGTVLMPTFVLFFPVPVAIAATAVVHLANNLFKAFLVGRKADWSVIIKFALPGAGAAMIGAALLNLFNGLPALTSYYLRGHKYEINWVGLVIGIIIVSFAVLDLTPRFKNLAFNRKYLPIGGLLSGFLGGISGIQGALRAAFLIKVGLEKEAFIGTNTLSAVIVDIARLLIYGLSFYKTTLNKVDPSLTGLILAAITAAFGGAFVGARLLKKVTLTTVQILVGVMLIIIGLGLASGLF
jgi:uncharacterized protein